MGFMQPFMPKPVVGINGSGMHTNTSLADETGRNVFFDPSAKNKLSRVALEFISGVLYHAKAMCLLTNPTVNSYKRLVPGYEAPCYISWSEQNRSTMIRIPAARGAATRVEIRSVDATANPYLAVAAILMAGLYGIENKLDIKPVEKNLFEISRAERKSLGVENLPSSLKHALDMFEASEFIQKVIGKHLTEKLIIAKK